jgi:RNA polymerase sigma factor (sigma-70 family)
MTALNANSTIKSLTKCKQETGELYARRPEVELQIEKILSLADEQILALLENKQKGAADYLFDETIVYLLREARNSNNNSLLETLYLELNRRMWRLMKRFYKNFTNHADFEDFGQAVEMAVIKKIFDITLDSADYAQVNLGDFVVTQAKVLWRGKLARIQQENELFQAERADEEADEQSENRLALKDISTEKLLIIKEAIAKLPQNIREVAVLHYLDGWQIESKDEGIPTISKQFNVSSRTIRNWLAEARQILAGYEGEGR